MQKEEFDNQIDRPTIEISRWEMRNLLKNNKGQELKEKIDLCLYYSELSIGPVLAISTGIKLTGKIDPFHAFKAPVMSARYIQHLLVWWLTLTGNKNLAETALYNNLRDHEKLLGCWSPHFSFLVSGEATAIETKVNTRKLLHIQESELLQKITYFLKPISNDPTKKQYIPPERQGKRGKYDPGPVFGTSIDFLRSEYEIQNFFNE